MANLTGNQRRQIIEAALAVLDQDSLGFEPGSGLTMLQEMRGVIENTLDKPDSAFGDPLSPQAITSLFCAIAKAAVDELKRQAGAIPDLPDEFWSPPSNDDTIQ